MPAISRSLSAPTGAAGTPGCWPAEGKATLSSVGACEASAIRALSPLPRFRAAQATAAHRIQPILGLAWPSPVKEKRLHDDPIEEPRLARIDRRRTARARPAHVRPPPSPLGQARGACQRTLPAR